MAKFKKFIVFEEARDYAIRAKEKFPDKIGHVDLDKIKFVMKNVKNLSNVHASIEGTRPYWRMFVDFQYTVFITSANWKILSTEMKLYILVHELSHIPKLGHIEGSKDFCRCIKHDIQDFSWMRKKFGVDLENLKDIIKDGPIKIEEKEIPKRETIESDKITLSFAKKRKLKDGKTEIVEEIITF